MKTPYLTLITGLLLGIAVTAWFMSAS